MGSSGEQQRDDLRNPRFQPLLCFFRLAVFVQREADEVAVCLERLGRGEFVIGARPFTDKGRALCAQLFGEHAHRIQIVFGVADLVAQAEHRNHRALEVSAGDFIDDKLPVVLVFAVVPGRHAEDDALVEEHVVRVVEVDDVDRHNFQAELFFDAGFDAVIIDQNGTLQTDEQYGRILKLIGPATLRNSFDHIAERGIVCNTGLLGNQWYLNVFDPIMELKNDSYLTSFYSGLVNAERLNALFAYVDQYNVRVPIERVFSLSEVADAHRFLQSEHSFGKVIVLND